MHRRQNGPKQPDEFVTSALAKLNRPLLSGCCLKCNELYYSFSYTGLCSNKCVHFKHGLNTNGYKAVSRNKSGGRIYEHRVVMGNPEGLIVHHINEIKTDNRPENLEVITRAEHNKIHKPHEARWGKKD